MTSPASSPPTPGSARTGPEATAASGPPLEERARAKINLDLCITGCRADGYHELDSVVVFADLADRLELRPAATLSLALAGPGAAALAAAGPAADNLVLRAAQALAAHAGHPGGAAMRLVKHLPVAAGIGGGSADAAAALRGLNRLWRLGLGTAELLPLAARLGADVPACLASRSCRMQGIGERLSPLPDLPALPALLVNPRRPLPTAAVFAALDRRALPAAAAPVTDQGAAALLASLAARGNHLYAAARQLEPILGSVLAALAAQPGCRLAGMSGSGATCFGLFAAPAARTAAAQALQAAYPGWWLAACRLGDDPERPA